METVISIILTSIIAIVITWYFTRKQMKKNEITHFSINSYDVGKGLKNEFPQFKLTYEDKELSNEVLVLKGGFINSGRNDIIGLKNDADINIILPEECSLKEIHVKQLSNDLGVKACKNKEKANIISFGIDDKFMSGESFEYSAIIEATKEISNLHRKIEFKHRIPNTSKIINEYIMRQLTHEGHPSIPLFIREKSMGFVSLIAAVFFCLFSLYLIFLQKVQCSPVDRDTNSKVYVYITPLSKLYISDNDLLPFWGGKNITTAEFNKDYYFSHKIIYSWSNENTITGIMLAIFALVYFTTALFSFYLWNKKKHIYKLLEQYEHM